MKYPPNVKYPLWLIWLEKRLGEKPPWFLAREDAERLQNWLATRRLNSVVPGLLQSLFMQAYNGSLKVTVEERDGETPQEHDLRRLAAQADHAVGAHATIQLFIYNELRQRGQLHLIDGLPSAVPHGPDPEPEDEVGGLTRIGWSCPVCGGPGDPMPGGRWGCADGHPAVWDDGHGAQVQILPEGGAE